jgi:hypothetical protein
MGWLNANALTLIDAVLLTNAWTVLLDEPGKGAANPWAVAWTADSQRLVVTHAGTHEISIVQIPELQEALVKDGTRQGTREQGRVLAYPPAYEGIDPGPPFLVGARRRVPLGTNALGPRAVVIHGHTAYVTNHFSRTVSAVDLDDPASPVRTVPLEATATRPRTLAEQGEVYFHDATLCYQGWQSCASCHPQDGRVDGLNWDLLNDGLGNPKNTKSLLGAFDTPPAMSRGVRETAGMAVRAGLKHILFAEPDESIALAIDAYIRSLKPLPSPWLEKGKLSPAARRGEKVFQATGCQECHPPPWYTDLQAYEVGTLDPHDPAGTTYDTPSLIELWRTAPYLHDGSAGTLEELFLRRNPNDLHGKTSNLTPRQTSDLCEYLKSL